MGVVRAHGFDYHVVQHRDALFHQHLHTAGTLFQIPSQKYAGSAQNNGYQQRGDGGLGDVNAAKNRNGKVDVWAGDIHVHEFFSPFFLRNSETVRMGRVKTSGITNAKRLNILASAHRTSTRNSPMSRPI